MDQFSLFFTFYGLILGLAVTEILSSVGAYVRARPLRSMEMQSALLAFVVFLVICATWIDAWATRDDFSLSFASMWAPIGAATAYYLAAAVVLPKESEDYQDMAGYLMRRKSFVVSMLIAAELFVKVTYLPTFSRQIETTPAIFWLLAVPLNIAIFGAWLLLLLARSRRLVIAGALAQIVVFSIPYWSQGWISKVISASYGYA
jgi:hypothetical protein